MDNNDVRALMEEQLKLSRKLKARIQELEAARKPALAVVGMAMRLPGDLNAPDAYWRFLRSDSLALSDIPEDRPGLRSVYSPNRGEAGRSYVKRAGFLSDLAHFDAQFFGISQREAEALDPQQRMLLETSWEAMERAGIAVRRQDRLPAGVFVGIMASEYNERLAGKADKSGVDPYYGTGGGHCFAAGRISYALGFSGPALSVDTACSSSLVAFHLGVQSLRRGECRYVIVAGSNLLLSADLMVSLAQSQALAPDGRSKTFTAAADGYGRGEGVGALVLMRLDDAEREQRPILAVVRGTAVNHDGASSGLTVPSGPAQQEVIRAALQDGGVSAEELGYVEAHGTGTALGDPIEVGALDAIAGSGAPGRKAPLAIGSVKARIGHLEAAAGVAGLLKLVLMLQHGQIPATLSESDGELNSLIPWEKFMLSVPRRATRWPSAFSSKFAGISAFGLSGTNAHAVLEGYVAQNVESPMVAPQPEPELVIVSAKDRGALEALTREVCTYLDKVEPKHLSSVCHTLRAGRAPFKFRLGAVGKTPEEIAHKLREALTDGALDAPATSVLAASLRIGSQAESSISQGLAVWTQCFPQLAERLAGASPDAKLEGLFAALGVRTKSVRVPELHDQVQLEWGGQVHTLFEGSPERARELLLGCLLALHLSGADLRLGVLAGVRSRYLADLPTYAFQRRRYWIDELLPDAMAAAVTSPETGRPKSNGTFDLSSIENFLVRELTDVLRAEGDLDRSQTFLEVGGDSFTVMLLKKSIEQQFNVEVPLEALSTEASLGVLISRLCDLVAEATGQVTHLKERSA